MKSRNIVLPSSITIDDFDVQATPSLIGFWKCNEDAGSIITDHSKYGHHLTKQNGTEEGAFDPWTTFPGYVTVHQFVSWLVDTAGTPLETGSNIVVLACETKRSGGFDYDSGQSWKLASTQQPTYGGVILAGVGYHYMEVIYNPNADYPTLTGGGSTQTPAYNTTDTEVALAGAFTPGVDVNLWAKDQGNVGLANRNAVTALAQAGPPQQSNGVKKFGLGGSGIVGYRNYQAWSFSSVPPYLDVTLQWMVMNPGKVPIWWEGL